MIFCSDLDNTMVYSLRRNIGENKVSVEIYKGRAISFMTPKSMELLKEVCESVTFVPTTTRNTKQYKRINLGIGIPDYALVCNGGVLLVRGERDEVWYEESLRRAEKCKRELQLAEKLLTNDPNCSFEVRWVEELFIFAKSEEPRETAKKLEDQLALELVTVHSIGSKIYVIPNELHKGEGIRRLKERLKEEVVVAAGDSIMDIPMLKEATVGILPFEMKDRASGHIFYMDNTKHFAEQILEYISKKAEEELKQCEKNMLA